MERQVVAAQMDWEHFSNMIIQVTLTPKKLSSTRPPDTIRGVR
jgi:hypothetical protein